MQWVPFEIFGSITLAALLNEVVLPSVLAFYNPWPSKLENCSFYCVSVFLIYYSFLGNEYIFSMSNRNLCCVVPYSGFFWWISSILFFISLGHFYFYVCRGLHLCFQGEWCQTPVNRSLYFQIIDMEFSSWHLKNSMKLRKYAHV